MRNVFTLINNSINRARIVSSLFTLAGMALAVTTAADPDPSFDPNSDPNSVANDSDPLFDASAPIVATVGEVEFRACNLEAEGRDRPLQCAWYQVPENYATPEGEQIELFIARIPAQKANQSLAPMLFLAGGPGQAASDAYLHIDRRFDGLAKTHDFYLIDQRGTGHSHPLTCDETMGEHEQDLLMLQNQSEQMTRFIEQCLQELPGDPRFYTTSVAIQDFENIRAALEIEQWNLFGASYGTRVAQHYIRRHEEAIRTAILDSVVPPEHSLGTDIAVLSQQILEHLYDRCEQSPECHSRFPNLKRDTEALFARLKEAPVEVQAESFSTGRLEQITFTHAHLTMLVRMYLYHTNSLALLPPVLHEAAAADNFSPIARAAKATMESMDDMLSLGMHNAVMCTEDAPFLKADSALMEQQENTYMGTELIENLKLMCDVWPEGVMDDDFKAPLESGLPILLLSGEYDPITPPAYADQVMQSLTKAKHLVFNGQGHFVSVSGCAPHLLEQFVNTASIDGLNSSCLERLSEAPLFINFNAPSP